jgi:hypothetical protein
MGAQGPLGGVRIYVHGLLHTWGFKEGVLKAILIQVFFLLRPKEFLRVVVLFYEVKNGHD